MKAFICLAISMLLVGLLYVYVRQQFALIENHVNELKNVIKMLALPPAEASEPEVKAERPAEELVCVSDDSEEESDEEDEVEDAEEFAPAPQVAHVMMQGHDLMHLMQQMSFPGAFVESAVEIEEVGAVEELPELEISELSDKVVVLSPSYENMSVKELREKVQLQGGPSLKTKKQLVDYLEKNVSA
jgi:hypothetical protein